MIDRGDIRQAIDRCSNIWASLPGAGYGQFEHKADSLIAKFKEAAERSERLMWMSRVTAIISALVICIIVCLSWPLTITVITPLPTKPSATKCQRTWSWRTRQLLTCRCVSVMLLRLTKNTRRELADAKLKMMLCVMMLPLVVVGCTSKQSAVSAWSYHRLRRDNAASPDWQTPLNGIISPLRERLITMQKQLEGTQKYINEQCRDAHIDGQLMQLLWAIHTRFQRSKCLK